MMTTTMIAYIKYVCMRVLAGLCRRRWSWALDQARLSRDRAKTIRIVHAEFHYMRVRCVRLHQDRAKFSHGFQRTPSVVSPRLICKSRSNHNEHVTNSFHCSGMLKLKAFVWRNLAHTLNCSNCYVSGNHQIKNSGLLINSRYIGTRRYPP